MIFQTKRKGETVSKLGRLFRDETDYNAGPQTLRAIARSLARLRVNLKTMEKEMPTYDNPVEAGIMMDQIRGVIDKYSSALRMASESVPPRNALMDINKMLDAEFETFWEAYQGVYDEYEAMVSEIINRSGNVSQVREFETLLTRIEETANGVAAYEEKQRQIDPEPAQPKRRRGRHTNWRALLV